MRIAIIGTGYVGLVSAVCISEFGLDVTCFDINADKIEMLKRNESPIYEPGLEELLQKNSAAGRLKFTNDLDEAMDGVDAVMIAVGTPTAADGVSNDLTYVYQAVDSITPKLKDGAVVIIKCTVAPGTNAAVRAHMQKTRPELKFSIASNPEFLREGSAIDDFFEPDRVVIGSTDDHGKNVCAALYEPLKVQGVPIIFTSLENAEICKYASNALLAVKISFINEVADLCEAAGGDVAEVSEIVGLDNRIGAKFLQAGPGYGGSCFPKDTRALAKSGQDFGAPMQLVETVVEQNEARKQRMAQRVIDALKAEKGDTVALLGIAFKPNTDDIREAPPLAVIDALLEKGVTIRAYDPQAMDNAKQIYGDKITWCDAPMDTADDADVMVLATEWMMFGALDLDDMKSRMAGSTLVDLRNLYDPAKAKAAGFSYISIGRKAI